MKTRLRIILSTLVLIFFVFSLSACDLFTKERDKYDPATGYFKSDKLDCRVDESYFQMVDGKKAKVDENLITCIDFESFSSLWNETYYYYMVIEKEFVKAKIAYHMSMNETNDNNYQTILSYYLDFNTWIIDTIINVSNSNYRSSFFSDMSEEEIDSYISKLSQNDKEEDNEYNKNLLKYENELYSISKDEYNALGSSIYKNVVSLNNSYAKLKGYDNYILYINDSYNRDYSLEEIELVISYIKQYIVPLLVKYHNEFINYKENEKEAYVDFFNLLYNPFAKNRNYLDEYANYLSGDYLTYYNDLFTNGHYFLSNLEDAYNGAYTSIFYDRNRYMYFGPDYQGIMTFTHEFGHYVSGMENSSDILDVNELQSQGNELLFISYLDQQYDDTAIDILKTYYIYKLLYDIVEAMVVYDYEMYVYENNILDETVYSSLYKEIALSYGDNELITSIANNIDYWISPCISSSGYYISYSVSALSAFSLFSDGYQEDKGKNEYLEIIKSKDLGLKELCNEVGLLSPFVEESYITLSEILG
ncbi:MAG: hypothetical protein ACI35W_06685 [Anaeroplasmataceae bacterium]